MPSTRTLRGRLPSGAGRWGRRNAQKAPHKAAKDPYEPDLLGRLFRLRLTPLPTTSAARTGCRGATNGQPNQQAFHQRGGHNRRYKEEFHRRTSVPNRRTVRRCPTIPVKFGQPPATCPLISSSMAFAFQEEFTVAPQALGKRSISISRTGRFDASSTRGTRGCNGRTRPWLAICPSYVIMKKIGR